VSEHSERFYSVIKNAACANTPNEWFYPLSRMLEDDKAHLARARAICQSCKIQTDCYAHAIRHEEFGFWAGLSPRQRRIIRINERIPFESLTAQANTWQINWNQSLKRAGRGATVEKQRGNK